MAAAASSLNWKAVLLLLAIIVAIHTVMVVNNDMTKNEKRRESMMQEAGMMPTRNHVHLKQKKKVQEVQQQEQQQQQQQQQTQQNQQDDHREEKEEDVPDNQPDDTTTTKEEEAVHRVAGLNCDAYGGPSEEDAAEMVYWQDIESDSKFVSPLKAAGPETKYLTFEPDEGGWNNIRMSMETAVALSHAMGRTLVMPPEQGMYLLAKGDNKQKNRFTFSDFFHFDSVAAEHSGVEVISMKQFLEREVLTGHIRNPKVPNGIAKPPQGRVDWDGAARHEAKQLDLWMRLITKAPIWPFDRCVVGLPAKPGPEGIDHLHQIAEEVKKISFDVRRQKYTNNPVPVDAEPEKRIMEMFANRKDICVYDESFQNAPVVHMMGDNNSGARLLIHFYAYLFFEDWRQDLWHKRFVRDHLRYVDEIQCAAARVVKAMRRKAREHGNEDGVFDTFHIRRGDFQYKDTRVEASVIYENIKDLIPDGSSIYIATDERDKSFFKIFHEHYHVYFLDDFMDVLDGVNTNFYGMLDQRIASKGRKFIGCFYSTFSGYINRMRGYHSQLAKAEGWEQGIIDSWYYIPNHAREAVREYRPIAPAMWAREFPIGWRDLDKGIEEIAEYATSEK